MREAGGVTFVPVPGASNVDHVGILAIELPPTVHKGKRYSVRVRQITAARFGAGRAVEIGHVIQPTKGNIGKAHGAKESRAVTGAAAAVSRKGFLYRRTIGAFGVTIPVGTKAAMLPNEERTLCAKRMFPEVSQGKQPYGLSSRRREAWLKKHK